jgi:hypothetical protein
LWFEERNWILWIMIEFNWDNLFALFCFVWFGLGLFRLIQMMVIKWYIWVRKKECLCLELIPMNKLKSGSINSPLSFLDNWVCFNSYSHIQTQLRFLVSFCLFACVCVFMFMRGRISKEDLTLNLDVNQEKKEREKESKSKEKSDSIEDQRSSKSQRQQTSQLYHFVSFHSHSHSHSHSYSHSHSHSLSHSHSPAHSMIIDDIRVTELTLRHFYQRNSKNSKNAKMRIVFSFNKLMKVSILSSFFHFSLFLVSYSDFECFN